MVKFILFGVLTVLAAFLYRAGGIGKPFNTKWRDIGDSLCFLLSSFVLGLLTGWILWGSAVLSFGLSWAALSTYRYWLPRPRNGNYTGWHYALHGFMVSFSDFPFALASGRWIGFVLRCIVCSVTVGLWSHWIGWDDLEEGGRGFFLNVTRLLYLIPAV